MTSGLPVKWAMPTLPSGWSIDNADVDSIGYWLGGRRLEDGSMEPALSIRLRHEEPLAFAHVVLRTREELVDFLGRLEGMTPFLRSGLSIELKYY